MKLTTTATTAIVNYFFRGSWWPPCRAQLMALQEQYASLKEAGVQLVVITAEPGGSEAVRKRLLERGVPQLDYDLVSDPDHSFLTGPPTSPDDLFVFKDHKWEVSGDYKLVQPALVVYNPANRLIKETTWSWKTMGLDTDKLDWDTRVATQAWEGEPHQVMLVTMRPIMSDLLEAIQQKRPVKLASTHKQW